MVFPEDWACTKNGKTKQKRAERRRIILGRFIDRWRIKYKIEQPPEKRETFMDFFQWLGRIAFARTAFDGGWGCGIFLEIWYPVAPRFIAVNIWFIAVNIETSGWYLIHWVWCVFDSSVWCFGGFDLSCFLIRHQIFQCIALCICWTRSTAIHRGVYLIYRGEIWFFVLNIENRHEIWFREIWFITMHFNPLGTNKMMWGKWHMPVCRWAYLCIIL